MPRYVAFLRGVSPMNAKMPELKRAFEAAGFTAATTLLSSGNVVFNSPMRSTPQIERTAEAAMQNHLGRTFLTIVRRVSELEMMIESDPFAKFNVPKEAKRVVTFLRTGVKKKPSLPIERDDARILSAGSREVFSVYVPGPRGPVFMALIERTFGKDVTTRTWDTVKKCAKA